MIGVGRRLPYLRRFAGIFVAALTLPSLLLSLVGATFPIHLAILLVGVALVIAHVASRPLLRPPQFDPDGVLPTAVSAQESLSLRLANSESMARAASALATSSFGSDTIPCDRYESLHEKNRLILVCLVGSGDVVLGYFDVIPLAPSFAESFLRGHVSEAGLRREDVLAPEEMTSCTHIYIGGVVAKDAHTHVGRQHACVLVWGLLHYLRYYYGRTEPTVLASAATPEGDALLQKFGLNVVATADRRSDGRAVYSSKLTLSEIDRRIERYPDYRGVCDVTWASPTATKHVRRLRPGSRSAGRAG